MLETAQLIEERIRRFTRLGGVDLSRREEEDPLHAYVHSGLAEFKKTVFTFRCPMCGGTSSQPQELEPMCTGPSWTDDHPPTVMELVR